MEGPDFQRDKDVTLLEITSGHTITLEDPILHHSHTISTQNMRMRKGLNSEGNLKSVELIAFGELITEKFGPNERSRNSGL